MSLRRAARGFSLAELAVVALIVGLLLGGMIMTLSAQLEQRDQEETTRRVNAAVDAVLGFALVNRRLPCPATANTTGDEAPAGGGTCTTSYGGFLPARTIGFQPIDSAGYGVDVWGNRIRYAVAGTVTGCVVIPPAVGPATPHFTNAANLKANGMTCKPHDLDICTTRTGSDPSPAGIGCANTTSRVVSGDSVVFIVFSTGKNGALPTASQGTEEQANTDDNKVFVSRLPGSAATGAGAYDDIMVFVPVGVFYSKMVAAGVLP